MPKDGSVAVPVEEVTVRSFRVPTDAPESDGTIAWDATTMVVVEVSAAAQTGLGYTYSAAAAADVVAQPLTNAIVGQSAFDVPLMWTAMVAAVRNIGWRGVSACAISAVDVALWDLKGKLLSQPVVQLLGAARSDVPIYGSGGFTSYCNRRIAKQLGRWVEHEGCRAVKMKVGRQPEADPERVLRARTAIGEAELYVDANGALSRKQALSFAERFRDLGVSWFEEPVSSDDLAGLRLLRDRGPPGMNIAAGEYGYEPFYFRRMLEAGAVDVLQADATRCGGYTGFLRAAALADAHGLPLSAHCAPALHLPVATAAPRLMNVEWFHDHVRIERMAFDGAPRPSGGYIRPDLSRPGIGLVLKEKDIEQFAV
jgi:L-alanine-DL-glutamate epimerase-like enolase superfamily enzyme